jgi:hypothetical protein
VRTLPFFCNSLIDPFFEVFEILDTPNHPQYQNLVEDIAGIDANELGVYVIQHHVDIYLNKWEDKNLGRRAYFIIDKLQNGMAEARLNSLLSEEVRPAPYNSQNLHGMELDGNNLVSTEHFDGAFVHNGYGYILCPSIIGSNSSYWTTNAILQIMNEKKVDFKIRLDPFIEKALIEFNPMMYRMTVYGTPLKWDELKNLKNENHGRWIDETQHQNFCVTEYVWRPSEKEINFTCEELPSEKFISSRGSRYFHAIFCKKTGRITHCDGAIRFYNEEEFSFRLNYHVRNNEARKIGKRIKLFQINNTDLTQEQFALLLKSFMVWNDDILKYFS